MTPSDSSDEAPIPWLDWSPETERVLAQRGRPILAIVEPDIPLDLNCAAAAPFMPAIVRLIESHPELRRLLRERFPAARLRASALSELQSALGAGSRYFVAILSPYGFTPMLTADHVSGKPEELVAELAKAFAALDQSGLY